MVIRGFYNHIIECEIIIDIFKGNTGLIPRITLMPSTVELPFSFSRRQFPIKLAFAMTINKAQGQTMDYVGLYLPAEDFTHGQLYVALSRVTNFNNLSIIIKDGLYHTKNIVYKEIIN